MELLEVNYWGTVPQWIQASLGVGTLVLALISKFQSKKIKELIAITDELSSQTEQLAAQTQIFAQSLDNEKKLTSRSISPFFIYHDINFGNDQPHVIIRLENIGYIATSLDIGENFIPDRSNVNHDITVNFCKTNELWTFNITCLDRGQPDSPQIQFAITYKNIHGQKFKQIVSFSEGNYRAVASPPELIVE